MPLYRLLPIQCQIDRHISFARLWTLLTLPAHSIRSSVFNCSVIPSFLILFYQSKEHILYLFIQTGKMITSLWTADWCRTIACASRIYRGCRCPKMPVAHCFLETNAKTGISGQRKANVFHNILTRYINFSFRNFSSHPLLINPF